jgi:primosomal protein N' (replication factor Y) (superfamily II helicase)
MAVDGTSLPHQTETLFADVIIPRHIAKAFTYLVPPALTPLIGVGGRVLVPFGRVILEGVVISLSNRLPINMKAASIKEIHALPHVGQDCILSPALFELSRKIAEYYVAPWGQCLRLIFSPMRTQQSSPRRYVATQLGRVALKTGSCPDHLRPTLHRIARRATGISSSTLQPVRRGNALRTIDTLIKMSWIDPVPFHNTNLDRPKQKGKSVADMYDQLTPMDAIPLIENLPEVDSAWSSHIAQCLQSNHTRKIVLHAPWQYRIRRLAEAINGNMVKDRLRQLSSEPVQPSLRR